MWVYVQIDGALWHGDPEPVATGYSGAEPNGKNKPNMEAVVGIGPIPCGYYTITGPPYNDPEHGPFVMKLIPDPTNQMFGRSDFLMHGDSIENPGCASKGCIIMPRNVRERVWNSGDRELLVTDVYLANQEV
jgi:hypothetical protein